MPNSLNKHSKLVFGIIVVSCVSLAGCDQLKPSKHQDTSTVATVVSKTPMPSLPAACNGLSDPVLQYMDSNIKQLQAGKPTDYWGEIQEDEDMSGPQKKQTLDCYEAQLKAKGLSEKN